MAKLQIRLSQLKNELERREKFQYNVMGITSGDAFTNVTEILELRIRIKEVEYLLGDLTKNFNKV